MSLGLDSAEDAHKFKCLASQFSSKILIWRFQVCKVGSVAKTLRCRRDLPKDARTVSALRTLRVGAEHHLRSLSPYF